MTMARKRATIGIRRSCMMLQLPKHLLLHVTCPMFLSKRANKAVIQNKAAAKKAITASV